MSKYIFMVILSVSISIQCLRCMSTVNMIVQREENITVLCNVNSSYLMAWYRLSSERITLLISASKDNINKHFVISHNEDKGHFQLKEDNVTESISLAIIRIGEPDIGLYYCAARILGNGMQFGTPIRLIFADTKQGGFSYTADNVGCSTLLICAYAACGICGIICACVLCYRRGSSADSCISCVKKNSNSKAADMQYASLRFVRESRAAVPASVDVTYATVTSRTS